MLLYLLVSEDAQKFKIGVAEDLFVRYLALKKIWSEFNLYDSCIVEGSDSSIRRLERTLHFAFDHWHISNLEVQDGYTEWFEIECLHLVKQHIQSIDQLRQHSPLKITENVEGLISARQAAIQKRQEEVKESRSTIKREPYSWQEANLESLRRFETAAEDIIPRLIRSEMSIDGQSERFFIIPEDFDLASNLMRGGNYNFKME